MSGSAGLKSSQTGEIYSAFAFNKIVSAISSFILHLNKKKGFKVYNYFDFKRKSTSHYKPKAVFPNELIAVFAKIEEIKRTGDLKDKYFNVTDVRHWIPQIYMLQLITQRRREDLMMAKWSDLFIYGSHEFISIKDYKVSRAKDDETIIPVIIRPEFKKVLDELGYERFKFSDEFVIYPESLQKELISKGELKHINGRNNLMNKLSRSFPILYKLSGGTWLLEARSLKKAGITALSAVLNGTKLHELTNHSSDAVPNRFYVDDLLKQILILEAEKRV